jgi:hypothetical protein
VSDDLSRRAAGLDLDRFAQSLRVAHCARGGDHPCAGTCTITPSGVELSCKICGDRKEPVAPSETLDEVRVAKAVLAGLGIDWTVITPETQRTIYALVRATGLVRRKGAP